MKIVFPKEMKIRTFGNAGAIILAGLDVLFGILMLAYAALKGQGVLYPILALAAGGLYFLMAKLMWSLKRKVKQIGMVLLICIAFLGMFSSIVVLIGDATSNSDLLGATITYVIMLAASIVTTALVYYAEAVLIKMKYLVYS